VRYRYYVSHAAVQGRRAEAGSVARVPAPEIESLVLDAVRKYVQATPSAGEPVGADRDVIEQHVARIVVKPNALEVGLVTTKDVPMAMDDSHADGGDQDGHDPVILTLPWATQSLRAVKGIIHAPEASPTLQPDARQALLTAIAEARGWIDDLLENRVLSFGEIAAREGKAERHIRLLAPLAFTSPRIIATIIDGTAPPDLTVTGLARALPHSWAKQERQIGLSGT
jgi:hypothetical protein